MLSPPPMCGRLYLLQIVVGALACAAMASAGGCAATRDDGCTGAKCDSAGTFQDKLAGRSDPIGRFLRAASADADGVMEGDYRSFLFGVAGVMGCPESSVRTFSVSDRLLGDEPFPRLISLACADDDARASDFFIAASFQDEDTGDVDLRDVEMFAWDGDARTYRFYAFAPAESDPDKVEVEVEPKRCQQCHLTPTDLLPTGMPMTPIMNELTRPWTHWNAEPGFPSFHYALPAGIESKENFAGLLVDGNKESASRLELIIKNGGHLKTVQARLRERRNPANLTETMSMLRPVFCSEQLNYASEDFQSGVLLNAAVIDPGLRNMYKAIRPDNWAWGWINGETMRISAPASSADVVVQIPVRGNADLMAEKQLVAVRALTPEQVLRVRALDWKRPVLSELRCGLWTEAEKRFRTSPPSLAGLSRNSDALPVVFEAIMEFRGRKLDPGAPDQFIALGEADPATLGELEKALADGTLDGAACESDGSGFCLVNVDQLGAMLEGHLQSFEDASDPRAALRQLRDERICQVLEPTDPVDDRFEEPPVRFENRPAFPTECH